MKIQDYAKDFFNDNNYYYVIYSIADVKFGSFDDLLSINLEIDDDNVLDLYLFNEEKQIRRFNGLDIITNNNSIDIDIDNFNKISILNNKNNFRFKETCVIDSKAKRYNNKYNYIVLCNNFEFNEDGILFVKSTTYYKLER